MQHLESGLATLWTGLLYINTTLSRWKDNNLISRSQAAAATGECRVFATAKKSGKYREQQNQEHRVWGYRVYRCGLGFTV